MNADDGNGEKQPQRSADRAARGRRRLLGGPGLHAATSPDEEHLAADERRSHYWLDNLLPPAR
jgi:hypothetical protein